MHAFRDVEVAAYCPRKLYYRRQEPAIDSPPPTVTSTRDLAFEYDRLLTDDAALTEAPIEVTPTTFRSRLGCARARLEDWGHLVSPADRDVFLEGRECRGIAHKLLPTDPPSASLVFTGRPPDQGVWQPQTVRLMAVAKALSWEYQTEVKRVYAEYPAYGVIRKVPVNGRRSAMYREAVSLADDLPDPPARTTNDAKCNPCEYSDQCGVRTRSLRSLLGI